jgi:ABC-type lipopolysaccharide export system ATPase subunit
MISDTRTGRADAKVALNELFSSYAYGEIIGLVRDTPHDEASLFSPAFGLLPADKRFAKVGDSPLVRIFNSKVRIACLPQEPFFPKNVKVSWMLTLVCGEKRAAHAAESSFVRPLLDSKGYQLTDGEKRLLEIIMLVHLNVHLVLLEDLLIGVDPSYTDELKRIIAEQSKEKSFLIAGDYRWMADILAKEIAVSEVPVPVPKKKKVIHLWGGPVDLG